MIHAQLMRAFDSLFGHFGAQRWWPAETAFEVMVGAILTQNTNWRNVERALTNIKASVELTPRALYQLEREVLAELIRPAGYFNVKAQRLRNFIHFFLEKYDGNIEKMQQVSVERLREELLSVKGIGRETADSILLYALKKPVFVVDLYTYRVLVRHGIISEEANYHEIQELFMSALENDTSFFNEYHALLVAVGKNHCKPKARCEQCPLRQWNGGAVLKINE